MYRYLSRMLWLYGRTYLCLMTLNSLGDKKVLLISGDVLSSKVSTRDRASRPITGDATTISVIENTKSDNKVYCSLKNDGKDAFAVIFLLVVLVCPLPLKRQRKKRMSLVTGVVSSIW